MTKKIYPLRADNIYCILKNLQSKGVDLSEVTICFESFSGTEAAQMFELDMFVKYDSEKQDIIFTEAP